MPPFYATVTRIHSAYPEISSITAITSAVVVQFIDQVEAEINARIAKKYVVPVTPLPPLLQAISERETRYRILIQRGLIQFPGYQEGPHPLGVQHKDDQKLLEMIADGELTLTDSAGNVITQNTGT